MSTHEHEPWLARPGQYQNAWNGLSSTYPDQSSNLSPSALNLVQDETGSWLNDDLYIPQDLTLPQTTIELNIQAAQTSSPNDPTLAPEPSLEDFDLSIALQTPHDFHYPAQETNDANSSAQDMQGIAVGPRGKLHTSGVDTHNYWNFLPSDEWTSAQNPYGMLAGTELDTVYDYTNIGFEFTPPAVSNMTGFTMLDPLPEAIVPEDMPAGLAPENPAFVSFPVSATEQPYKLDYPTPTGYQALYPDTNFSIPFSPTPGLTSASTTPSKPHQLKGAQRDTSTDSQLVQLRQQGRSYKQIKETLGLDEAESTLRGRFRALTKPKEARVRKPGWSHRDIRMLLDGVKRFSNSNPIAVGAWAGLDSAAVHQFASKVPWKQVAEWMAEQGAYRYGNATVKKKYLAELHRLGAPV